MSKQFALITGGAHRIGAATAQTLHAAGYDILLHYGKSEDAATALQARLNEKRADSCHIHSAQLNMESLPDLITWVNGFSDELSVLVNNASAFYPTPWETASPEQWQQLMTVNLQVPFFLTQALLPNLERAKGSIVNLIDIHAERSLEDHPIYSATKAALKSLTLSLAKDKGNKIRANGVSPGAILWPEKDDVSDAVKEEILNKVPMQRLGDVRNIAQTVLFLCENDYINGQIINIDGGRTVHS